MSYRSLSDLRELTLDRTRVSDAGLALVANFNKLEVLSLRNTKLKGDGLAHLSSFTHLRRLNLFGNEIHDEWRLCISVESAP